jgi:hypothetical protein
MRNGARPWDDEYDILDPKRIMSNGGCDSYSDFYCPICKRYCSGGSYEKSRSCDICGVNECCISCCKEYEYRVYCRNCYMKRFSCDVCHNDITESERIVITVSYDKERTICRYCEEKRTVVNLKVEKDDSLIGINSCDICENHFSESLQYCYTCRIDCCSSCYYFMPYPYDNCCRKCISCFICESEIVCDDAYVFPLEGYEKCIRFVICDDCSDEISSIR